MLIEHKGKFPVVHAESRIAPNATLCGEVTIGRNCSIGFGAVLTAESGPITLGDDVIVMDTAVIRGVRNDPVTIGNNVLIGPRAYLTGCEVQGDVFLATGTTVFNGAVIGARSEVRVNAIVHLRTRLPPDSMIPLGWIAVGDPARILPPDKHQEIWSIQKQLDFPKYVFGVDRPADGETIMPEVIPRYASGLRRWHLEDIQDSSLLGTGSVSTGRS